MSAYYTRTAATSSRGTGAFALPSAVTTTIPDFVYRKYLQAASGKRHNPKAISEMDNPA